MLLILRPINLFIVALTLASVRWGLLSPMSMRLGVLDFAVLVFCTLAVTAAGYVVNDCCDGATDRLNKPHKTFIPDRISLRGAWMLYGATVASGLAAAGYLAGKYGNWPSLGLYPAAVALLWYYSADAQKRPLLGNLLVAVFCAAVVYVPLWGETADWADMPWEQRATLHTYAGFAFFSTLARELVKDMEDVAGDTQAGYRTLPIALGDRVAAAVVAVVLSVLAIGQLAMARWCWEIPGVSSGKAWGLGLGFVATLVLLAGWLRSRHRSKAWLARYSTALKLLMGMGLLWLWA
jgi:4-hydroxybenzoate polyprenyltransferase